MKIKLLVIGKTSASYLEEGIAVYLKRLVHYIDFSMEIVPDVKVTGSTDASKLKDLEAAAFLKRIQNTDQVVLLDEKGKRFTSEGFASEIGKWMNAGDK